jgi:hypothetical protein
MPIVFYRVAPGASVSHLGVMEDFLDENRERISYEIHDELITIFEEMDASAKDAWTSMENQIEELNVQVTELEERINELEEELNDK